MPKNRQESIEDVQERVWQRLATEGLEAACEALIQTCRDPKGTAQSKATAGRTIFEAAGMLNKAREHRDLEAHEMSPEQLADAIADLERLKTRRANGVSDDEDGVFE